MDLKKIREDLHKIPELGFQEFQTQKYIEELFKNELKLKCHKFDFTGLLYEYDQGEGPFIMFRADMDALPIQENTGCSYRSRHQSMMHACGHDVHMTILIGLINKILKSKLQRNILFLFQPAEEGLGGAERIIATGILNKFKISNTFALHLKGSLPIGTIASRPGIFFANAEEISVLFKGISAHVAFPEKGRNALAAGVRFYTEFKTKLKKKFPGGDSVIVEFGKMRAGTVMNAVADKCKFEGTIRTFKDSDHEILRDMIAETALQVSVEFDLDHKIEYGSYYKHVNNDPELVEFLIKTAENLHLKYTRSQKEFTGEDFGFFTHDYRGLLFWLGTDQGENTDLHSDKYLPSAEVIPVGVSIFWDILTNL
jgi:N-acetyldiaminopimelate deacetylase